MLCCFIQYSAELWLILISLVSHSLLKLIIKIILQYVLILSHFFVSFIGYFKPAEIKTTECFCILFEEKNTKFTLADITHYTVFVVDLEG